MTASQKYLSYVEVHTRLCKNFEKQQTKEHTKKIKEALPNNTSESRIWEITVFNLN